MWYIGVVLVLLSVVTVGHVVDGFDVGVVVITVVTGDGVVDDGGSDGVVTDVAECSWWLWLCWCWCCW